MEQYNIHQRDFSWIVLTTIIAIGSCVILRLSLVYGFLGSIGVASLVLRKRGFGFGELGWMVWEGIKECKTLYLLILLIGATVSIWLSSGVVPAMIYYGFTYMQGMNFLLAAFLITSIMSVFMGTAVGTISTIGIALMGIGQGFGVPEGILLGAIVSGAFIADKMSPISGLLNLTMATTKVSYKRLIQSMVKTFVPVLLLCAIIYLMIGRVYTANPGASQLLSYQRAIVDSFTISPWLLLLPLGVVCMSIGGMKTIHTIAIGLGGGVFASGIMQKMSLPDIFHAIYNGYQGATPSSELNRILVSGGVRSMMEVLFIVLGAISLSSILERTGLVQPLVSRSIAAAKSKGELVWKTGLISSLLTMVTCDQTVGIILPGRLLREKYDQLGIQPEILARTISDTGTIIAPLFPWNVNALIIGMITGIGAGEYAPYAVLCYLFPLVSVALSFVGKMHSTNKYTQTT